MGALPDPIDVSRRESPHHRGRLGPSANRCQGNPVVNLPATEFEDLVALALDRVPPSLARLVDNVIVVVEENPPPGDDILGLYEGIPLTERGSTYAGVMPDRITIFRQPILEICSTRDEVVEEVLITVVHEIAHHFGIDDDRLHELGWG